MIWPKPDFSDLTDEEIEACLEDLPDYAGVLILDGKHIPIVSYSISWTPNMKARYVAIEVEQ